MRKRLAFLIGLVLLLMLALPAAAASPSGPAPAVAGLTGVVTDPLGHPVAGAEVEVYHLGAGLTAVLVTDAHGGFRVEGAAPGSGLWQFRTVAIGYHTAETGWIDIARNRYQAIELAPMLGNLEVAVQDKNGGRIDASMLLIGADGHVAGEWHQSRALTADRVPAGEYRAVIWSPEFMPVTRPLTVAAGRSVALLVTLDRAAAMIAGEVRDAVTGQPVADVSLEVLRDDQVVVATGLRTDGAGRFQFGLLQQVPERLKLRAVAEGYTAATTQPFSAPGGQGIDFSGAAAILLQPATGVVAGTVLDEYDRANQTTQVVLEARGFGEIATHSVDAHGHFQFDGVLADQTLEYRVRIAKEDEYGVTDWLPLTPGLTDQLVIKSRRSRSTYYAPGTGSLSGTVVTVTGAPLPGATVELFRENHLVKSLHTDQHGGFMANDLSASAHNGMADPDPYTLRVSVEGYVPTTGFLLQGQMASQFQIATSGRTNLRVAVNAAITTLRGRVVDSDGLPVAGAEVSLANGLDPVGQSVVSTGDGWYTLTKIPVPPLGHYALKAQAQGFRPIDGVAVTLAATALQTLPTLKLVATGATYAGQVLGLDGQPLSDIPVTVPIAGGIALEWRSGGTTGAYRGTVPPGFRPVAVVAGGGKWGEVAVALTDLPADGLTTTKDLILTPAWTAVSGRVIHEDGAPAAGVEVELLEEGLGVTANVRTDAQGAYSIPMVTVGSSGWFWLRINPADASLAGSLRHGTELVPQLKLTPGQETVIDLLVK
jgi:large repetitive protein